MATAAWPRAGHGWTGADPGTTQAETRPATAGRGSGLSIRAATTKPAEATSSTTSATDDQTMTGCLRLLREPSGTEVGASPADAGEATCAPSSGGSGLVELSGSQSLTMPPDPSPSCSGLQPSPGGSSRGADLPVTGLVGGPHE